MLKYFVSEEERKASHSTCYFEFQQGHYHDQCWLPDSLSISDTLWDRFDLSKLFERVIGEFDYYGTTMVTKAQWDDIVKISQDTHSSWQEIIGHLLQCHKSFLVNPRCISKLDKRTRQLWLTGCDIAIPIGEKYQQNLREWRTE